MDNVIKSDEIKPTSPIRIPNQGVDYSSYIIPTLADLSGQENIAQKNLDILNKQGVSQSSEIANLQAQMGGKAQDIQNIYDIQGVTKAYNQIADLNAQAKGLNLEAQAIPIQTQQNFANTGATDRGVAPITAGKLRENALKALSLAQQAAIANSQYDKAKNYADQMIDAKYMQKEASINARKTILDSLDKYQLNPEEKKLIDIKSKQWNLQLKEIEKQKEDDKAIQNIGIKLGEYGVDNSTIQKVLKSGNVNEAISIAGSNLRDPKARYELEKLRVETQLAREKIETEKKQRSLMGELTPAERKAEKEAMKQAKTSVPILENKVTLIDGILNSKAIDSTVGTTGVTRAPGTFGGVIGRASSIVGIPSLVSGAKDKITGDRQELIGSVNQLVSKEFLDSVLSLKAQGGTLGQITEREGTKLQEAATKIGTWEIRNKDGKVVGYNVAEQDFKDELKKIQDSTRNILNEARGSTLSPEEQQQLDNIYGTSQGFVEPQNYYQTP